MNQGQRCFMAGAMGVLFGLTPFTILGLEFLWCVPFIVAGLALGWALADMGQFKDQCREAWHLAAHRWRQVKPTDRNSTAIQRILSALRVVLKYAGVGVAVILVVVSTLFVAAATILLVGEGLDAMGFFQSISAEGKTPKLHPLVGMATLILCIALCVLAVVTMAVLVLHKVSPDICSLSEIVKQPQVYILPALCWLNPVMIFLGQFYVLWWIASWLSTYIRPLGVCIKHLLASLYALSISNERLASTVGAALGLAVGYLTAFIVGFTQGVTPSAIAIPLLGALVGGTASCALAMFSLLQYATVNIDRKHPDLYF
jgi:hypothetical protein